MRSVEEAQLAIRAGADAIGLIGTGAMPASRRAIDERTVVAIAASAPPPIATFLLTADCSAAAIAAQVRAAGATAVQICVRLSLDEYATLAKLLPMTRRVQVIHVKGREALDLIDGYAPHVHAFLLDSGRPELPTPEYGGTGRTHDWTVSAEFVRRSPRPVFLAGGLTAANVGAAIRTVQPFGVDVCTGVRTDGRLDTAKLEAFVAAGRARP